MASCPFCDYCCSQSLLNDIEIIRKKVQRYAKQYGIVSELGVMVLKDKDDYDEKLYSKYKIWERHCEEKPFAYQTKIII